MLQSSRNQAEQAAKRPGPGQADRSLLAKGLAPDKGVKLFHTRCQIQRRGLVSTALTDFVVEHGLPITDAGVSLDTPAIPSVAMPMLLAGRQHVGRANPFGLRCLSVALLPESFRTPAPLTGRVPQAILAIAPASIFYPPRTTPAAVFCFFPASSWGLPTGLADP